MPQPGRHRLTWQSVTLQLRNPFRVAHGVSDTRQAFVVDLGDDGGEGTGEGTIPPYYRVDPSAMTACWERAAASNAPLPDELEDVEAWIPDGPAPARSALDLALHDRIARRRGVPLYRLLGLPKPPGLASCFTIGIDAPDAMGAQARQIADYGVIKLKLGSGDDADEARVRAVREARPDVKICVDANAGWTLEQALAAVRWLERYKPELIEQPLPKEQIEQMGEVQRRTPFPVVADESVQTLDDVERLAAAGVHGINVKLMKVGGLSPALRILKRARELKLRIMLGCMIETSIGITAAAHLSGLAEWVDLDAPLLIVNDPFTGVMFDKHARMTVPERPGIGAVPVTIA